MSKINWRERFVAVALHLAATLLVIGITALLIFYVWFPDGLAAVTGGMQLFFLVVGCDVALGPLISFVIYNPPKGRAKIVFDYIVVGCLQIAALCYGVFVVAQSRPVFVAFDVDRIEIVSAIQLEDGDLSAASKPEFQTKSLLGPKLVSVQRPTDPKELSDITFAAFFGASPALKPKYYGTTEEALESIKKNSAPLDTLIERVGATAPQLRDAIAKAGTHTLKLGWLAAHHRFGFAVALVDRDTGVPVAFVALDPTIKKKQ